MGAQISFDCYSNCFLGGMMVFHTSNGDIFIESFNKDTITIFPAFNSIQEIATFVADCFKPDSNLYGFKTIIFEFNGVQIGISAEENPTPLEIIEKYLTEFSLKGVARQTVGFWQYYASNLTPSYEIKEIESIILNVDMEFKNDNARVSWYNSRNAKKPDGWTPAINGYAEAWCKMMQHLMCKHKSHFWLIAEQALFDVTGEKNKWCREGVDAASECWKYGDDLLIWYDKREPYTKKYDYYH